ncbi:MAG: glycosyl hydrolase, partial [Phycisphaerales bacterium]
MDGNLSREGITADLEAMKQAGIGGVILMEVDVGVPRGPVRFMSEPWRAMFKHAVTEAERLGLQMTLNAGPGWTGSGGPWVKVEQSMQHLVAGETRVTGGQQFRGVLPQPQPRPPFFGPVPAELESQRSGFYRDVAVLAFPTPADGPGIADLDDKALYVRAPYSSQPGVKPFMPAPAKDSTLSGIVRDRIADLTDRLDPNGRLTWDVPEGEWTILRFGRTTTGANTRPAPQPGLGFECDKFDPAALDTHFDAFVGTLLRDIGPRPIDRKVGWTMLHIDSWEMGSQNWSEGFREEFQRRRGYDPLPYLPVMTGRVVDSLGVTERFLWDLRQTAQELVIENHAQHLKALGRQYGFGLSIEPYDMNPCSDLSLGGVADIPMCEFWAQGYGFDSAFSCIEATSIAHTLGRPIVAAEAFTSDSREAWKLYPGAMKRQADWAFCMGINRLVFHRFAHQPWLDRRPGMTMGPYGVHYERTQTWWPMVGAWHQYLARCQAMLQRGRTVADICCLAPEGAPHVFRPPASAVQGSGPLRDRKGYSFDGCAPETLLVGATVKNGQLVLAGGASYRVLVLPNQQIMTPPLLRKIRDLVEAGATVIGPRPIQSPSLSDYPRCDQEVLNLSAQLWGPSFSVGGTAERRVGKGRTIAAPEAAPRESESLSLPANAHWIWRSEGNPAASAPVGARLFRRTFTIEANAKVESAKLLMTADNAFEIRVNDKSIGQGDSFKQLYAFDLTKELKPGDNVLSVTAENGGDSPNPAGLIGALIVRFSDGHTQIVATDHQWQSAESDGADWQAAMDLGEMGMAPWGKIDAASDAEKYPDLYCSYDLVAGVLREMDVPSDFESDANLRYTHRRDGDTDIYFVANPADQPIVAKCAFRVTGKRPEIWDPMTGEAHSAGRSVVKDKRTRMELSLEPCGSAFVVFSRKSLGRRITPATSPDKLSLETEIAGPWEVRFEPQRGAPEKIVLNELIDWSKHSDPGVKYFSGQATYRTRFTLDPARIRKSRWLLDLGRVQVMAQVKINGKDLGVLWKT